MTLSGTHEYALRICFIFYRLHVKLMRAFVYSEKIKPPCAVELAILQQWLLPRASSLLQWSSWTLYFSSCMV